METYELILSVTGITVHKKQ